TSMFCLVTVWMNWITSERELSVNATLGTRVGLSCASVARFSEVSAKAVGSPRRTLMAGQSGGKVMVPGGGLGGSWFSWERGEQGAGLLVGVFDVDALLGDDDVADGVGEQHACGVVRAEQQELLTPLQRLLVPQLGLVAPGPVDELHDLPLALGGDRLVGRLL